MAATTRGSKQVYKANFPTLLVFIAQPMAEYLEYLQHHSQGQKELKNENMLEMGMNALSDVTPMGQMYM